MQDLTPEDKFINDHIEECNNNKCNLCNEIYYKYFATPSEKATNKYQRTDKYKQYRKKYYFNRLMLHAELSLIQWFEDGTYTKYNDEYYEDTELEFLNNQELNAYIQVLHDCKNPKEIRRYMRDIGIKGW
jgi:hypothetical protein